MKLYTEEQVREAFIDGMKFIAVHPLKYEQDADEYINSLTPIELPTDEEIQKQFTIGTYFYTEYSRISEDRSHKIEGAKWVIQHITSQIKQRK